MSTFGGLNTAYRGLVAARAGLEVVGQNIANVNTEGYTRQRVVTSSLGPVQAAGMLASSIRPGQGVLIEGIDRIGDVMLDARVRSSLAVSGYWAARSSAMTDVEATLREPGENGLSAQLQEFWSAWQEVANRPDDPASSGMLLEQAGVLVTQIARGYQEIDSLWSHLREESAGMVREVNLAAAQIGELNERIRSALADGSGVNEMIDERDALAATVAELAGGVVRDLGDGTVEVLVSGNAIVSGDIVRSMRMVGATSMEDPLGYGAVRLEWEHSGLAVAPEGGGLSGALSMLAPAAGGAGGGLAESAAAYNTFATALAQKVNDQHRLGNTTSGTAGGDFFLISPGAPARNLSVIPTASDQIAAAAPTEGPYGGGNADAMAQLSIATGSPDSIWSAFVTRVGVITRTEERQSALADLTSTSARDAQLANASVSIDEENVSMLTFQTAYQGAARVMTAIDQMLDTLINRTGIVGR